MKNLSLTLIALLLGAVSFAQSPQKFNYQAIVRNAQGVSVSNQLVGVKVSILEGSTLGAVIFSETHGPTTNDYGHISLQIGTGTNTGPALSTIDWGANQYYIKIEIDPTGGTSYTLASTSQLVSVPYALHAKTVDNADDADADPTNELITGAVINGTDLEITDAGGTTVVDMSSIANDADSDPLNEIQTLSKVGQIVTLSNGGGAFTDDVNDADASTTNELNTGFQLIGTTLQITDAGGTLNADLSGIANDADSDPSNEIQILNKVGQTVTLSNGGGSFTDEVDDADADNTNELQTITKVGSTVTLSDGGGSFTDAVNDADPDPSNELQTVNKVGNTVTLSTGGGSFTVDDSDADPANELITGANLTGTDLNITDAGTTWTVDLSSLGGGGNPTDELNTTLNLNGTTLELTDAGGMLTADLSSLVGGGDPSSTNELNTTLNLNGTTLELTDAGGMLTADLSSLVGGGDPSSTNELITNAQLSGTDLIITEAGTPWTVDLSSLSGGGGSSFKVGQLYGGGVIVYVDSTGTGGFIAALSDVGFLAFENGGNGNSTNTTGGQNYVDGALNTSQLIAALPGEYLAAEACDTYTAGGHSDWFLPALYQLEMMMQNNYAMGQHGAALTPGVFYWSSTIEFPGFGLNAWKGVGSSQTTQTDSQTVSAYVRPMRAF